MRFILKCIKMYNLTSILSTTLNNELSIFNNVQYNNIQYIIIYNIVNKYIILNNELHISI